MPVLIGTSGWQYRDWRPRFYPERLPQRAWLEHYVRHFDTVESNAAFYHLPAPETFESWAARTPGDFVFAVKANRYLTHIRRLRDPAEVVARMVGNMSRLGGKLGPILLQLPPNLKADLDALARTLDCFDDRHRVAVEFRHDTWFTSECRALLEERRVALCLADRGSRPIAPLWRTAPWGYLRLHSGTAAPRPCYGRSALASWARRLAELWGPAPDVFVYFNNDHRACAVRDARSFARAAERAGLEASRVPSRGDVGAP